MGKRLIKHAVKRVIGTLGRADKNARPRILTYHSIGDRRHDMSVTRTAFADQMAWLADHAQVRPLEEVAEGKPGIAITFDDGFRDNLTTAAPILAAHGLQAHLFMVAERAGGFLPDEPDLDHGCLMTLEELRAWREAGHGVGAHTCNHVRLSTCTAEEQENEIRESRRILEDTLGAPVTTFAYPYGSAADYDTNSIQIVKNAGFVWAFSNRYGGVDARDKPYEIRRIWIDASDTMETFVHKVTGKLDGLALFDSRIGLLARRTLNRLART